MKIWIDIINPSHALFFSSLLKNFTHEQLLITIRDRAETKELVFDSGLKGRVIGKDYRSLLKKSLNTIWRTYQLTIKVHDFDYALSFENGMSVATSKVKGKQSILLCDNDLKFFQSKSFFQDFETTIKSFSNYIIVPKACYQNFKNHATKNSKILFYDGYKEDIYIAGYKPDINFLQKLPFKNFVVIRPESLGSFYVKEKRSLVPQLLKIFQDQKINVIYIPREKEDKAYAKGLDVFIPEHPLNGLDLCYYADAILTGSGTMAREAACLGTPSVSFFPGNHLLSVDKQLVNENKIFHSRNPQKISRYLSATINQRKVNTNLQRSKKVKKEVTNIIKNIIYEQ